MFRVIPSANRIIGSINSLNHNLPAFEVIYNDLKVILKEVTILIKIINLRNL